MEDGLLRTPLGLSKKRLCMCLCSDTDKVTVLQYKLWKGFILFSSESFLFETLLSIGNCNLGFQSYLDLL